MRNLSETIRKAWVFLQAAPGQKGPSIDFVLESTEAIVGSRNGVESSNLGLKGAETAVFGPNPMLLRSSQGLTSLILSLETS